MSDIKIGQLITSGDPKRDAIHVAVTPATAGERLEPGDWVTLDRNHCAWKRLGRGNTPVGIVDPFLKNDVQYGEKFWLFVTPGTVRNLRHSWDHDYVPDEEAASPAVDEYEDDGCRGC